MPPPQASIDSMWPLSLVCHLLVWPVQHTVYTCCWDQASESQGYHSISVDATGTTLTGNGVCAHALETHTNVLFTRHLKNIEAQPRYQDLGFVDVDPRSLSFHIGLWEDQLLLQFLQRLNDDDLVICIQVFPGTSCTKLLGKGFQSRDQ